MKNATLRQLKVFEAVARHLSYSRAAEELHLTQPAVSIQVKALEGHEFDGMGNGPTLYRAEDHQCIKNVLVVQGNENPTSEFDVLNVVEEIQRDAVAYDPAIFGGGNIGPIPTLLLWMLVIGVIGHVVLRRTKFGRQVLAVGGNVVAARYSGINTGRIKLWVIVISAVTASIAGMLLTTETLVVEKPEEEKAADEGHGHGHSH